MSESDQSENAADDAGNGDSHNASDQMEIGGGEPSQRASLLRLAAIIAAIIVLSVLFGVAKTVLVVFAVVVMIMIHELGHFLTAKWAGMKVTEYFIGFGPKLWSIRRGETEYGIKAIPAGAYVRIIGMSSMEEVDEDEEHRTYRQKPYWRRMSVAVAGSFMHFVMAYLLLVALQSGTGLPVAGSTIGGMSNGVNGPTPAQAAGLQVGDKIIALDGNRVKAWDEDVPPYIESRTGQVITVDYERNGERLQTKVTPVDGKTLFGSAIDPNAPPAGKIGIASSIEIERTNFFVALGRSAKQLAEASVEVVKQIGHIFSPTGLQNYFELLTDSAGDDEPEKDAAAASDAPSDKDNRFLSPVGFVGVADGAADAGIRQVLILLFSFNLFIGIFNLIPLLPFDGGHVAVATYEKIRSRRGKRHMVDFAKLIPVSYAVVLMLVFIGLSSLWLDIFNPVSNPFE